MASRLERAANRHLLVAAVWRVHGPLRRATDNNRGGQFTQDFLSASNVSAGEHRGTYLEMQTGRAASQMHTFPLPAGSSDEWTEWFDGARLPTAAVHSNNYSEAMGTLDRSRVFLHVT